MKFAEFKRVKQVEAENRKVTSIQNLPSGKWGGREVIREGEDLDEDVEYLRMLTCLTCGEDLTAKPSPSVPSILYYTCTAKPEHRFILIGKVSPLRGLLDAAAGILTGRPMISPTDIDEDFADHMGRLRD